MHKFIQKATMLRLLLLGCLVGAAQLQTVAQGGLSLEELVSMAIEENYQIRILKNLEQVADNRNTIGQAGMLPTVGISGEARSAINNSRQQFFTGDSQEASNATRRSTSAAVDASWIVFDGFAMFARRDQLDQLTALGT